MQVLLTSFNSGYIHKNLALRWLYVTQRPAFDVELREFTIRQDLRDCVGEIFAGNYDVVAFSVYIWNVEVTRECIRLLKEVRPQLRIILGGPEVSYENDEWFELPIEAIIQGEGEFAFWDYLEGKKAINIKTSRNQKNVPQGITDLALLEELEMPYFLEFDQKSMSRQYLYLETSRGCPYGCTYCLSSLDNRVRYFSLAYLGRIFEKLAQSAVEQVKFLDRTFNLDEERALQIGEMALKCQCKCSYQFEIVADTLSDKLLQFMLQKDAITRFRYEVGVQSFNPLTLAAIERVQDNKKLLSVLKLLIDNNVVLHTDLIAGLPEEDNQSFSISFQTLFDLRPSELQLGELKLLKGTKLRQEADKYEIVFDNVAPYTIVSNRWLKAAEMKAIHWAAIGIDKTYNHGKLCNFIAYMSKNFFQGKMLQFFTIIGTIISKLPMPYQPHDFYQELIKDFSGYTVDIELLLVQDYYYQLKQRPPQLFAVLPADTVKRIKKDLCTKAYLSEKEIYSYTDIHKTYYNDKEAYLIVLYSAQQEYCRQFIYNEEGLWRQI